MDRLTVHMKVFCERGWNAAQGKDSASWPTCWYLGNVGSGGMAASVTGCYMERRENQEISSGPGLSLETNSSLSR